MFRRRLPIPAPRTIPWRLKCLESAETSLSYDGHGRMVMRIRHDVLQRITPEMVAWWFANIGGDLSVEGKRLNRYLVWHPYDHIAWELARAGPDGKASAGAQFRIVEVFGGNSEFYVDVIDNIERLDTTGFTGVTYVCGLEAARLNHDFSDTDGGTRYISTLTVGVSVPVIGKPLNRVVHRMQFTEAMGRAWIKHNIEEVGLLEHIIPIAMEQPQELPANLLTAAR